MEEHTNESRREFAGFNTEGDVLTDLELGSCEHWRVSDGSPECT